MAESPKKRSDTHPEVASRSEKGRGVPSGETARAADSVPMQSGPFAVLPTQFGRYRVDRLLGKGMMGAVYLAHDQQLDRAVALKVARVSATGSAKLIKRMETEAKAAANIDHPLICKVYDFGEIDGIRYIALQYIEGEDLKSSLKRRGRRLEPAEAVRLVLQLASSLQAAHKTGVIHRDLKPENVMLNRNGEPVIMDFGLAKRSTGVTNAGLTQGMILGTAAYMSPEQAAAKPDGIDQRSDLYALGVMLFEMLTGEWPFTGSAIEVMGKKCIQDAPSPHAINPGLSAPLVAVCQKLIARAPDDRYSSCAELIAALESVDLDAPAVVFAAANADTTEAIDLKHGPSIERLKDPSGTVAVETSSSRVGTVNQRPLQAFTRQWWRRLPLTFRWTILGGTALCLILATVLFSRSRTGDRDSGRKSLSVSSTGTGRESKPGSTATNDPPSLPTETWIDLLQLVKTPDHAVMGQWSRQPQGLVSETLLRSRFMAPVAVSGSYEATCRFSRRSGKEAVTFILPVGQTNCAVMFDGWGGTLSGLYLVDRKGPQVMAGTPAVARRASPFANGVPHQAKISVMQDGQKIAIKATLDEESLVDWNGTLSQLSGAEHYRLPNPHAIGVCTYDSILEVHDLKLRLASDGRGYRLGDDWKTPIDDIASQPSPEVAAGCRTWKGKHYFLSGIPLSLTDAQYLATQLKGRLLTISSAEEEEFIDSIANDVPIWMAGWRPFGLSWRDERNRPLQYTGRWSVNQPDNARGEQNQLQIQTKDKQGWDDVHSYCGGIHACIEWGEEYPAAGAETTNPRPEDKIPVVQEIRNGDFRDGLNGWILEGGATCFRIVTDRTFDDVEGMVFTTFGKNGDNDTGRMTQSFQVPDDATVLQWAVHGMKRPNMHIALLHQGQICRTCSPLNNNNRVRVNWDLVPLRGETVTLEIVDMVTGPGGYIGANDFKIVRSKTGADPVATATDDAAGIALLRETLLKHTWHYHDNLYPPGDLCRFRPDGTWHKWNWNYWVVGPQEIRIHYDKNNKNSATGISFKFNESLTKFTSQYKDPNGRTHIIVGTRQ